MHVHGGLLSLVQPLYKVGVALQAFHGRQPSARARPTSVELTRLADGMAEAGVVVPALPPALRGRRQIDPAQPSVLVLVIWESQPATAGWARAVRAARPLLRRPRRAASRLLLLDPAASTAARSPSLEGIPRPQRPLR